MENNDRLENMIVLILEKDIERSLVMDSKLESSWMWWRRIDFVNDYNETVLEDIKEKITLL